MYFKCICNKMDYTGITKFWHILLFFYFCTYALACDKQALFDDGNAVRNCTNTDRFMTCTSTCKDGFIYNDGNATKTFECENNVWSYNLETATNKFCLNRYWPLRKLYIRVRAYHLSCGGSAIANESKYRYQINETVDEISRNCSVDWTIELQELYIYHDDIDAYITLVTKQTILNNHLINECIGLLQTEEYFIQALGLNVCGPAYELVMEGGKNCPIPSTVLLSDAFCVTCGPGYYFTRNKCERCPSNTYQDSINGTSCKPCPSGHYLADDRSSCIALCPPGYLFRNEYTPCVPCSVDHYWVDSLTCRPCPPNTDTRGKSGARECLDEVENAVQPTSLTHQEDGNNTSLYAMFAVLMVISVISIGLNLFIFCRWRFSQNKSATASSPKDNGVHMSTILKHQGTESRDATATARIHGSGQAYVNMPHHGGESAPAFYEQLDISVNPSSGQHYDSI